MGEVGYLPVNASKGRKIYHTDLNCPSVKQSKKVKDIDIEQYPTLRECKHCSGEANYCSGGPWKNGQCRQCGFEMNGHDECPWCFEFDRKMKFTPVQEFFEFLF